MMIIQKIIDFIIESQSQQGQLNISKFHELEIKIKSL